MTRCYSFGWFRGCWLLYAVGVLLGMASWPLAAADRPNIVMIISDDQAWGDYGFMKHSHLQTPHLDRLASESLVYRRGYVPSSLCCPSLASIITGLYPHQHKITGNDPPGGMGPQFAAGREIMNRHMEAVPTLPRRLQQLGYVCLQTGKWWQGDFRRGGFTHGMTKGQRHGDDGLAIGRKTLQPIFDFIAEARKENKPFFAWYAPMMPHTPHTPPQRLVEKYQTKTDSPHIAKYWAMVEWFDETCGALLEHLREQKLEANTIVVYLTDNGWIQQADAAGFDWKSKTSPYDAWLRTPIMIRWPGKVKPAMCDHLASSIDLMPTLLKAIGAHPPASMPGLDLLDLPAIARRNTVFGSCYLHTSVDLNDPAKNLLWRWCIVGKWKLIVPREGEVPDDTHMRPMVLAHARQKKIELYDLEADPQETTNLADQHPEQVAELRRKLDTWWKPTHQPSRQGQTP